MTRKHFAMGLGSAVVLIGLFFLVTIFFRVSREKWLKTEHFTSCAQYGLGQVPEKTICSTAKSGLFELVEKTSDGRELWQDLQTGLLWSDRLPQEYDHEGAVEACKTAGKRYFWGRSFQLPSTAEFDTANAHGYKELLPSSMGDQYFWTSSPFWVPGPHGHDFMHMRSGDGIFDHAAPDRHDPVRCVGRRLFDFS